MSILTPRYQTPSSWILRSNKNGKGTGQITPSEILFNLKRSHKIIVRQLGYMSKTIQVLHQQDIWWGKGVTVSPLRMCQSITENPDKISTFWIFHLNCDVIRDKLSRSKVFLTCKSTCRNCWTLQIRSAAGYREFSNQLCCFNNCHQLMLNLTNNLFLHMSRPFFVVWK